MGYNFGALSIDRLNTCHEDIKKIMNLAIKRSKIDFGISEGHRSLERQQKLFLEGKSKIDGITKKGKHNYYPSKAVDVYIYHPELDTRRKLAYDKMHLSYLAGVIDSCVEELYANGDIEHKIRWGANWDSDDVIDYDQSFDDFPHFEIV